MFKVTIEIDSLKKLDNHINYVNKMLKMKTDKDFQEFIQKKCLEIVKKISEERLVLNAGAERCTNEEYFSEYNNNHKIRQEDDGFVIYNDLTVPANTKKPENYPNGFSIALAFEYGVGIVGENANDNPKAWDYNIHNYLFGWIYRKNGEKYATYGYAGFEIYRYSEIEIKKQLSSWVNEYFRKK